MEQNWISVTEKLPAMQEPSMQERVWVTNGYWVGIGYYSVFGWTHEQGFSFPDGYITHWMPCDMPEGPMKKVHEKIEN